MLDRPKRKAYRLHEIAWAKKQNEPHADQPLTRKQLLAARRNFIDWVVREDRLSTDRKPQDPGFVVQARSASERAKLEAAGSPRPESCGVCGSGGVICWDHCHTTGKFRGWLCTGCNTALGMAKDNPQTLRALADYLENS